MSLNPSHAIERLFAAAGQLPTIPRVVQKLIGSLKEEDADLLPLIADIRTDPTISARVLRLANSGYYANRRSVGSIDEAVTLIGTRALRTLVISAGVSAAFPRVPGVDLNAFWQHATLVANLCSTLARRAGENAEYGYSSGLMHRVGQLMIHIAFPRIAEELARDCHDLSVNERASAEQLKLHTNHCEVGAELAVRWNFPDEIGQALAHYCQPQSEASDRLARITHLCVQIAFAIEDGRPAADIVQQLKPEECEACGLDRDTLFDDIAHCAGQTGSNEAAA